MKSDIGSLIPLAVLLVPFLYMFDHSHPDKIARARAQAQQAAEIRSAFADKNRVIVIDMRGRG